MRKALTRTVFYKMGTHLRVQVLQNPATLAAPRISLGYVWKYHPGALMYHLILA